MRCFKSHFVTHTWLYICTRLNLCFAVFTLYRFSSNLTLKNIADVQRVYKYLQAIKNLNIVCNDGLIKYLCLEVYTDAN